jgi:hypothetical protein
MSNTKTKSIVAGCLLIAAFAGMAGAQVSPPQRQYLNTGLFSVATRETANFYLTLDDQPGAPPARVLLQFLDPSGAVVSSTGEVTLQAGQSVALRRPGPGLFRAHAEVTSSTLPPSARRTPVGTVEVTGLDFAVVRTIPSFDPKGLADGSTCPPPPPPTNGAH